jgi:hypothetical protein
MLDFMAELLMVAALTCHTALTDMMSVNLQHKNLTQPRPDRANPC